MKKDYSRSSQRTSSDFLNTRSAEGIAAGRTSIYSDIYIGNEGGKSSESNHVVQNCQRSAFCCCRRKHVWAPELLARCPGDTPCAFPLGPRRLFLGTGRPWNGSVLFLMRAVRSVSGLASGWSGSDNASGHWSRGMGALCL